MKAKKAFLIIFAVTALFSALGCVAASKYITPARIDPIALKYAIDSGVATKSDYSGYHNLYLAERLNEQVSVAHTLNQATYKALMTDDNTRYGVASKQAQAALTQSVKSEEALFGQTGLLSMGLTAMGVAPLAGLLGLMRKRPGDYDEKDISQIKEVFGVKEQAFKETVAAINQFKAVADASEWNKLKDALSKSHSATSKAAVVEATT